VLASALREVGLDSYRQVAKCLPMTFWVAFLTEGLNFEGGVFFVGEKPCLSPAYCFDQSKLKARRKVCCGDVAKLRAFFPEQTR
jgi:hypothetical protein